ncbi:Papain-like cysteine peptidase [Gracilaria domingensis]|nr:Papain-like cysteine peptidase [Gracilaria domingensis]
MAIRRAKATLSSMIMERIQIARISKVYYAHTDLFIGPFIGRHSSQANFKRVCMEVGEPHRFRRHQPLLVVTSDINFPEGFLIVVGGGHRILVAAHIMHIMILPYQVLDLSGLSEFGRDVSVLTHDAIISHHLEATEPRPEPFSLMEQVLSFARLEQYWIWREQQRLLESGKKPRRNPAMTQTKLMAAYDELKEDTAESSKYAIDFMSPPNKSTRQGYISGAQRMLKAGVVPYLCELESAGLASFPRRTLNVVKHGPSGLDCDYRFNDGTGSEVDGRSRGRKRRSTGQQGSSELKTPPQGWENYLNWTEPGSMSLLDMLQAKLDSEEKEIDKKPVQEVNELVDIKRKQKIIRAVRKRAEAHVTNGGDSDSFDLIGMIERGIKQEEKDRSDNDVLLVEGGVHDEKFTLPKKDYDAITAFSVPTDISVLFTLMYLNQWNPNSVKVMYVLESLLLTGWFETKLKEGTEPLLSLRRKVKSMSGKTYLAHHRAWQADLTVLPIVGSFHWTVAVLVNFPRLLDTFEHSTRKGEDNIVPSEASNACIFWFDSLKNPSPHHGLEDNLFHYLVAAYPGKRKVSLRELRANVSLHSLKERLQSGLECGFCVTYHVAIISKRYNLFMEGDPQAISQYVKEVYGLYPLRDYKREVLSRLQFLVNAYQSNREKYVQSPPLFWNKKYTNPCASQVPPRRTKSQASTEGKAGAPAKDKQDSSNNSTDPNRPMTRNGQTPPASSIAKNDSDDTDDTDFMQNPTKRQKVGHPSGEGSSRVKPQDQAPATASTAQPSQVTTSQPAQPLQDPKGRTPSLKDVESTPSAAQRPVYSSPGISEQRTLLRNALVGVLHGLVGMNDSTSPPIDVHALTSSVLNHSSITDAMKSLPPNAGIENAMEKMTPLVISKFRSIIEPAAFPTSQPVKTQARPQPPISMVELSNEQIAASVSPASRPTSAAVALVEEGVSLAQSEKDTSIKDEWEQCLGRMQNIIRKMKARIHS